MPRAGKPAAQTSAPPAGSAPGRLLSRAELAVELAVNPVTITKWQGEGLPVAVRGGRGRESKYRMADVWRWGLERERARAGGGQEKSLPEERAKLADVQRRRAEIELQKREGSLVERADVERTWGEHITHARTQLLAVPRAVADRCAQVARVDGAAGVERVLAQAIHDVLTRLAGKEN